MCLVDITVFSCKFRENGVPINFATFLFLRGYFRTFKRMLPTIFVWNPDFLGFLLQEIWLWVTKINLNLVTLDFFFFFHVMFVYYCNACLLFSITTRYWMSIFGATKFDNMRFWFIQENSRYLTRKKKKIPKSNVGFSWAGFPIKST